MMKRLPFLLLLVLLLPSGVWGATYYVDPVNGNNSWDGTSCTRGAGSAGPRLTANSGTTLLANGDSLLLLPGTYAGAYFNLNGSLTDTTIGGIVSCADTVPNPQAEDLVIIQSPSTNHTFYAGGNSDRQTLKYVTLQPQAAKSGIYLDTGNDGTIIQGVKVKSTGTSFTGAGINLVGATNFSISQTDINLSMQDTTTTTAYIGISGAASGTIATTIGKSDGIPPKNGIVNAGTGIVNLINNWFPTAGNDGLLQSGAGTTNTYNSGYGGASYRYSTGVGAQRTAGTLNAWNNLFMGSIYAPVTGTSGTLATDSGNLVGLDPRVVAPGKTGYVSIVFDDTEGADYFLTIEPLMAAYGLKGTFFVQTDYDFHGNTTWSEADQQTLRDIVGRGTLEVGAHTHSHSPMDITTLGTISYSGAGANPSYKIDLLNHQFLVRTDTVDTATINLASDNSDLFGDVLTQIRAATSNRWNITYTTNANGNPAGSQIRISSLSAVDWTAITTAIALDRSTPDCTAGACSGYYKDEIYDPKTKLETMIGAVTDPQTGIAYVCNSWAAPFTVGDATLDQAVRTAGYTNGRRVSSPQVLAYTNLYQLQVIGVASFRGTTEADTIQRLDQVLYRAAQDGAYIQVLIHVTDSVPLTGDNSIDTILKTLKGWVDRGLIVNGSAQTIATTLRTSPWSYNATTGITTRTITDQSDLRPTPASVLVGTGTNVCTDTDVPIAGCTATSMAGVKGFDGLPITNTDGSVTIGPYGPIGKKKLF